MTLSIGRKQGCQIKSITDHDSSRMHKACSEDSRTQRGIRGIPRQDHREHHLADGSGKKSNWR